MQTDQETHERLLNEERRKNQRILLFILTFHGTINLVLIIIYIDSSLEKKLSILGVYNFLYPLIFMIFLGSGGKTVTMGTSVFMIDRSSIDGLVDEGMELRQNRVESLQARISDFSLFIFLMAIGVFLFILSWLV
ncbi:MAG: hypothetical protein ACXAB7_14820 [Candidatus Kariarchaeaceae archaeon]